MLDDGAIRCRVWCNTKDWFHILSYNYIDNGDIRKSDEEDAFNQKARLWQLSYLLASNSAEYSDALSFREQLTKLSDCHVVDDCRANDIIGDILADMRMIKSSLLHGDAGFLNDPFLEFVFEKIFACSSYKMNGSFSGAQDLIMKLCRNIGKDDYFEDYAKSSGSDSLYLLEEMWRGVLALIDTCDICHNIEVFSDDVYTLVLKLDIICGKINAQKILLNILCAESYEERIDNISKLYGIMLGVVNDNDSMALSIFPYEHRETIRGVVVRLVDMWLSSNKTNRLMHVPKSYEVFRLMSLGYDADRLDRDKVFSYSSYLKSNNVKKCMAYENKVDVLVENTFKFINIILDTYVRDVDEKTKNLIDYITKEIGVGRWLGISEL